MIALVKIDKTKATLSRLDDQIKTDNLFEFEYSRYCEWKK